VVDSVAVGKRWQHSPSPESIPLDIHCHIPGIPVPEACAHEPPSLPHSVVVAVAFASSDRRVISAVGWVVVHHQLRF
jgi:hypothetical protein